MRRSIAAILLALPVTLAGCSGPRADVEPFPGFPIAVASNDCGPAGGAAVTLVLRPEPRAFDAFGPQIRVTIWREFGALPGQSIASDDRPAAATAVECDRNSDCAELPTWRVTFEKAAADSSLTGVLEAKAADGTLRRGRFRASWHPRVVGCM